jgi:hypothetical protein
MATMYEYAVILNEKRDKDGDVVEEAEIVIDVTQVLAANEDQAKLLAARSIPDDVVTDGKLDRLTVVVRPF